MRVRHTPDIRLRLPSTVSIRPFHFFALLPAALLCAWINAASAATPDDAPSATGLKGRLIVGYQGWFGCPQDVPGNTYWEHWFYKNNASADNLAVDLLPSVSQFRAEDLCPTQLRRKDGSTINVFSSQNARVVATHFRWMRDHGIDGAAVQRFVGPLATPALKQRSDRVLKNARAAAEASERIFYLTYDVSGADANTVVADIRRDWQYLVRDLKITASRSYLHVNGKPVLQLWGFGFNDRPGSATAVAALISDLKNGRDNLKATTLIGGVPSNWRTLDGDSQSDRRWAEVYRSYAVLSPWSVGRFRDDAGVDKFVRERVLPDMEETKRLGIGYMPVVFPGFSWFNLQTGRGQKNLAIINQIPRRCGNFLWRQVSSLLGARVDMLYAAMFDEVDEGTALFPTEPREARLPKGAQMAFLNQDGCVLDDDWYLRITGKAAHFLRRNEVPPAKLDSVMRP
ncbi:MAG: glycoside hydrolase family 71/99-like protein [Burkholderiales bacterium]|nr:glycoside hydrolase family 71/99-like protein [Burkholderiales bacterium]